MRGVTCKIQLFVWENLNVKFIIQEFSNNRQFWTVFFVCKTKYIIAVISKLCHNRSLPRNQIAEKALIVLKSRDFSRNVWAMTWLVDVSFAAWSVTFFNCWTQRFVFYPSRWQITRELNTVEIYFTLWVRLGFSISKFKSQANGGNQHFGDKIIPCVACFSFFELEVINSLMRNFICCLHVSRQLLCSLYSWRDLRASDFWWQRRDFILSRAEKSTRLFTNPPAASPHALKAELFPPKQNAVAQWIQPATQASCCDTEIVF